MEYRLTFDAMAIGLLAFCLSILATAGVLQWLGRDRVRPDHGMDRNCHEPGGNGRRLYNPESRQGPRPHTVGALFATSAGPGECQ
jgi:hypothetical protein